jgi:hypothetical protein
VAFAFFAWRFSFSGLLAAVFESTGALDLAGAGSVSASDLGHLARGVFLADAETLGR